MDERSCQGIDKRIKTGAYRLKLQILKGSAGGTPRVIIRGVTSNINALGTLDAPFGHLLVAAYMCLREFCSPDNQHPDAHGRNCQKQQAKT